MGDEGYPPTYWRDWADEARAKLKSMVSADGKRWMLEIARLYDNLADDAERRAAKKKKGDDSN